MDVATRDGPLGGETPQPIRSHLLNRLNDAGGIVMCRPLLRLYRIGRRAAVALACLCAISGCQSEPDVKFPEVELRLGQPVDSIRAWDWPRRNDGAPTRTSAAFDRRLTLHLPRGRRFAVTVTTVFLGQNDHRLRKISITPRPELSKPKGVKTLQFDEVTAEAERLARELGLEEEQEFWQKLDRWKKRRPSPSEIGSSLQDNIRLSDEVELTFNIQAETAGDGWHIALSFYDLRYYHEPKRWPPVSDPPVEAPKPSSS